MAKATARTTVSNYFKLGRNQSTIDFVDVPIGNDARVFLDPSRLRSMQSTWAQECNSLLQHFFETLLESVRVNDHGKGINSLEALRERNEFHLGFSTGRSRGQALGPGYAERIWQALVKSKASKTGLLEDIEDTCLFIDGVGADRVSDAVCNIIRGPLIRYTQEMCQYYGIPLTDTDSGPVWNPSSNVWENATVKLPITHFGKLVLVPKLAVRHQFIYDPQKYYTHYVLPAMKESEKALNSALVETLKDGRKRVTKMALRGKYGADKLSIVEQTIRHPGVIEQYRRDAPKTSAPMTHEQLAEVERLPKPDLAALLSDVRKVRPGKPEADLYEKAVEKLLSALFFPSLSSPTKQHRIHDGRKRVDITYVNNPAKGFFRWLAAHYSCAHIFIECKNYGKEIGNPEFDQLAGRFSPSRGQVGFLVCRSVTDADAVLARCKDAASDNRGYIIVLTDDDLGDLVKSYIAEDTDTKYPLLMARFQRLIM